MGGLLRYARVTPNSELLLDAVEQINGPQNRIARLRGSFFAESVADMTLQYFSRHTIHRGAGSQNLCDHLLAGLALAKHIDNAPDLPFDSSQAQLHVIFSLRR
jgi:hypothetical protein